jgi:hypothetical protein
VAGRFNHLGVAPKSHLFRLKTALRLEQEQAFALWLSEACKARARSMWYMPVHKQRARATYEKACIVFLKMKIFVCFIKEACLLAIISKWGGGDNSILRLSFAQQK